MSNKTEFCTECRNDVTIKVVTSEMQGTLKGEVYTYLGKKAICEKCGAEISTHEIIDYNLKALYDAYREDNSIITLEKIKKIPTKYSIGKRPLSLLLGWGELTFSRYCDGDMPTKQYSDILERIYADPIYYLKLLEERKDNLKSSLAYEKSKKATEELLGTQHQSDSKINVVIDYLLCKCEDITPLALQKLLYYVQGFYCAFTREYIFEDECEAWAHGPVYRDVYNKYSSYRYDPIEVSKPCDTSSLSSMEKAVIDSVIKNLSCYSGKVLEEFTHAENPWLKTRGNLPEDALSDRIIDKKDIYEYFKQTKEFYYMIKPADIQIYSKKMFEETV